MTHSLQGCVKCISRLFWVCFKCDYRKFQSISKLVNEDSKNFQSHFIRDSRMSQECFVFNNVSQQSQCRLKGCSFTSCLKGVSKKFQGVLNNFKSCFKEIKRVPGKFHGCSRKISLVIYRVAISQYPTTIQDTGHFQIHLII